MSQVPIEYTLILSAIIFVIGALGVLMRRNALIIFMCVEMMLNAVNLSLIALARQFGQLTGQIVVFFVMAYVRHRDTIDIDEINLLQG